MKITTKEIENTNIGIYRNARCIKCDHIRTLGEFIETVKSNDTIKKIITTLREIKDEDEQKSFKMNNLIGVTMSAIYGESRQQDQLIMKNNIMCVDVDYADNKELFDNKGVEKIKEMIFNLPYVYCVCLSCRGNGFFFIVAIPDVNFIGDLYTGMYFKMKEYGINIDKHCKDISRLRFISYDPNLLVKEDQEIEVFDYIDESQVDELHKKAEQLKRISNYSVKTFNDELKQLEKVVNWLIRIHFDCGDHWASWATIGKYFKTLGDDGRALFHKLSENMSGYKGYDDVEKHWDRFRECGTTNEALGKFYTMIKNKYGPKWRDEAFATDNIF